MFFPCVTWSNIHFSSGKHYFSTTECELCQNGGSYQNKFTCVCNCPYFHTDPLCSGECRSYFFHSKTSPTLWTESSSKLNPAEIGVGIFFETNDVTEIKLSCWQIVRACFFLALVSFT